MTLNGINECVFDFYLGMEREQMFLCGDGCLYYARLDTMLEEEVFGIRFYTDDVIVCQTPFKGTQPFPTAGPSISASFLTPTPPTTSV